MHASGDREEMVDVNAIFIAYLTSYLCALHSVCLCECASDREEFNDYPTDELADE